MDKQFWLDIRANEFALPEGGSVGTLTEELFSYLGSTDTELRDLIAYETFANWLEKDHYKPEQIRGYVMRLIANMQNGLGERDTDSVFGRTFSVLFLAEIVHHNNKEPFLDKDEVQHILARALNYLEEEKDPRGYIPEKGWAHALAHTSDLLFVLANNKLLGRENLEQILQGIAFKLVAPTNCVYIHGEDDRLARAVITVYQRNLTSQDWLAIISPERKNIWKDSYMVPSSNNAYFNCRTFLRSLHLRVSQTEELEHKDHILIAIHTALQGMRQF
jgi:hypothetical protein